MEKAFWIFTIMLIGRTLLLERERLRAFSRNPGEWLIDLSNLAIHLVGLPLLQATVLTQALLWLAPMFKASINIGPLASLGLYVVLDYLWYWNHRWLHSYTWVWNLHAVHHSAEQVDVFTSARNSVWSHVLEIYIWFITVTVYLAHDPRWFLAFVVLGSISNFWTHTTLTFSRDSRSYRWISNVLITPHEHLWHHSTSHSNTNYGTVFSFWDRLHGTLHAPAELPKSYGNAYLENPFLQLLLPVPLLESGPRWSLVQTARSTCVRISSLAVSNRKRSQQWSAKFKARKSKTKKVF